METWTVIPIVGDPMFDFFFTLILAVGTCGFFLSCLIKLTNRS